jgi:hypothetical protein
MTLVPGSGLLAVALFWLFNLGFFLLLVVLVLGVVRGIGGSRSDDGALEALRVRLARGEITADEFERLRSILGTTGERRRRWWPWFLALLVALLLILLPFLLLAVAAPRVEVSWGPWPMGPWMMGPWGGGPRPTGP